jgi:hypothetical protein
MNCREICERLMDYSYDLLEPEQRGEIDRHLKSCPECAAELAKVQKGVRVFGQWKDAQPPRGLVTRAVAAGREETRNAAEASKRKHRVLKVLAVAACIVLSWCVGVAVYVDHMEANPQQTILCGQKEFIADAMGAMRVVVRDRTNLKPLAGAEVALSLISAASGEEIKLGDFKTNDNGTVDTSFRVPPVPDGTYRLVAKAKSSVGTDVMEQVVTVKREFGVLLSTDKPLYQPNQLINMRCIALKRPDLKPVAGSKAVFDVFDPKGNKLFKKETTTSKFGVAATAFQLADEITFGAYRISVDVNGTKSEQTVDVKRYVLPKFKVAIETEKTFYAPNDLMRGTLRAEYGFGKPVGGADVTLNLLDVGSMREVGNITGTTDANGAFKFETKLAQFFAGVPLAQGNAVLAVNATVKDSADHVEKQSRSVTVSAEPINVIILPENGDIVPGVENVVYVLTAYPDGLVRVTLPELNRFNLITVGARDSQGNRVQRNLAVSTGSQDSFILRTDKAVYAGGETVGMSVLSSFDAGNVYVDVIKDRHTMLTKSLEVRNHRAELALDLPAELFGMIEIHAYRLRPDGSFVRESRVVYVEHASDLKVAAKSSKDTFKPRESAVIDFEVTDGNGNPAQAALGISIVDEMLLYLAETQPALEKVYFTLEQELLKPMYQIRTCVPEEVIRREQLKSDAAELKEAMFTASSIALKGEGSPSRMYYEDDLSMSRAMTAEPVAPNRGMQAPVVQAVAGRGSIHSLMAESFQAKENAMKIFNGRTPRRAWLPGRSCWGSRRWFSGASSPCFAVRTWDSSWLFWLCCLWVPPCCCPRWRLQGSPPEGRLQD